MIFPRAKYEDENRLLLNILSLCENAAEYARNENRHALHIAGIYSVMYEAYSLVARMRSIPDGEAHGALYAYLILMRDQTAGRCIGLYEKKGWELQYHEGRLAGIDALLAYISGVLNK